MIFQAVEPHKIAADFEAVDVRPDAAEFEAPHAAKPARVKPVIDGGVRAGDAQHASRRQNMFAAAVRPLPGGEIFITLNGENGISEVAQNLLETGRDLGAFRRPEK